MKLQELEQKYEELGKEIEKLKSQQDEVIYVPDNIQFEKWCGTGDNLGLVFDIDRVLCTLFNRLRVSEADESCFVKCKLVKVDKPQAGNWYYCNDEDSPVFNQKQYYHKYISNKEYYYVSFNKDIKKNDRVLKNYWQVVRCDE